MWPFAFTIFLSAFLLFQVQPIIAHYILPWYGGSSAVWTACMLFFQIFLLAGYAYAHAVRLWLNPRQGVWVHGVLTVLAIASLPITPGDWLKPTGGEDPLWGILWLLMVTVGPSYLMVSATGPLLQHWFSQTDPDRSPYRLYALSNVGSLLGLLTYPFLVEPLFGLHQQTLGWSGGFVMFVCGGVGCGYLMLKRMPESHELDSEETDPSDPPSIGDRAMWVALAACGSTLLLAITNQVCQDVAVVPFLWVMPLALYLLSFIVCFDRERGYHRGVWAPLFLATLVGATFVLLRSNSVSIYFQVGTYMAFLFCACMVCHGEMVRMKPASDRLTSFYLLIALGGAAGGLFVNVAAPKLFLGYLELHVVMLAVYALLGWRLLRYRSWGIKRPRVLLAIVGWAAGGGLLLACLSAHVTIQRYQLMAVSRNFYGVIRVTEEHRPSQSGKPATLKDIENGLAWRRKLFHGRVMHGDQLMDEAYRGWATTYYGQGTGVYAAIRNHPGAGKGLKVGVVGLGVGTTAALARRGDEFVYYEINPLVKVVADHYFTYLKDSPAKIEIQIGDGHVIMDRQRRTGDPQNFDVLIVDAFNGDSIPMHLLTLEAMKLYWFHLKSDGILAINISNLYLNLRPVVYGLADATGHEVMWVFNRKNLKQSVNTAEWVLMTSNRDFLDSPPVQLLAEPWPDDRKILWTDDHSNLIRVLK